jgi:hypothetical protein
MVGNQPRIGGPSARARMMVDDSAVILKRFFFVQREVILMQAGWMPGTDLWDYKLLLPEFIWQDSRTTDELRTRVLELRYPERRITPDEDAKLLAIVRSMRNAPNSTAFVETLRLAIKPMLLRTYETYLSMIDHLNDGPTVRILEHAIIDLRRQIDRLSKAAIVAQEVYGEELVKAKAWIQAIRELAAQLEPKLLEAGELSDVTFVSAAQGGKPFEIARTCARDKRFNVTRFHWPDSLDLNFSPGEGLQLQMRQATHHANEIFAAETALECLFDLADEAPHEFLIDACRWAYDEIRHTQMGFSRFREWGFDNSEIPLSTFHYDAAAQADPVVRLAMIFYAETTFIHTKSQRKKYFGDFGDQLSSHDMDFDWADEQIHVGYGKRWLQHFLESRADKRTPLDLREEGEACVIRMRATATEQDRTDVMRSFERIMSKAKRLTIAE